MDGRVRTETGLRLANRQLSPDALVALRDCDYGFFLHYYERVTLYCREKALVVRDQYFETQSYEPEELFLGDFQVSEGSAELRFEEKPSESALLKELLGRTFGCYSPLKPESARVYDLNPTVFCGDRNLGTLRDIVAEFMRDYGPSSETTF
jgi:hypothetical protein